MPTVAQIIQQRRRQILGGGVASTVRRRTTTADLQQQVSELEALQQATGAPSIEQDKPGFLSRTIDVLSGVNYAVAGAVEEIGLGNGPGSAVKRFAAELYSSARSLPLGQLLPELGGAQKEAFGEVLKSLGVGTKTLADAVPMLEGTFIGELVNTRGTAGLALDIAADPLTYFSFGLSAVARRTLSRFAALGVKKGVNKKGLKMLQRLGKEIRASDEAAGLTEDAIDELATRRLVDLNDASLFDPGGIKFAGVAIPGTPGLGTDTINLLSKPIVKVLNSRGIGHTAVRTAEGYYDALKAIGRETFGEFGPLEKLSGPLREEARRTARKYVQSAAQIKGRYVERFKAMGILEHFAKNPTGFEKWWRVIDSGNLSALDDVERGLADALTGMTSEIGEEAVVLDILKEAQVKANPNHIVHSYKDMPDSAVMETWRSNATTGEKIGNKHAKQRPYKTMEIGAEVSGKRAKVTQALRAQGVPVEREVALVPDYSMEAFEAKFLSYLDWYSKQKTARLMARDFAGAFGFDKAKWGDEVGKLIDGGQDFITEQHKEWGKVMNFFERSDLGKMAEDAAWGGTAARQVELEPIAFGLGSKAGLGRQFASVIERSFGKQSFVEGVPKLLYQGNPAGTASRSGFWTTSLDEALSYAQRTGNPGSIHVRRVDDLPDAWFTDEFGERVIGKKEHFKNTKWFDRMPEADDLPVSTFTADRVRQGLATPSTVQSKRAARIEGFEEVMKDAVRRIGQIDDPMAKRQFVKELMLRTRSVSQFVNVWDGLEKAGHLDLLPRTLLNLEGTAEDALLRFGEKANYVAVGGNSLWGKGEKMVPRLIADYVENASSKILNTKDYEGFRAMIEKWDSVNNLFKNWVYPYFPSSQVRNAYSNVFLSGLRIGWHAINPFLHQHSIMVLAGKNGDLVTKTGRIYPYEQIRELFSTNNIAARFEQLTEQTGKGASRIQRKTGVAGRARQAITAVENEARYALGIQGLIDGLTPAEAAADVAEFLFNYNEIGPIHRAWIQRLVPFSTFTLKNLRAQTKALRTQPGRVINQLKPFRGDQSENDQMVKFEAEGLKLRIDGDGRTVRMLTGLDAPLRNLDTIWAGGFGATGRRMMGMMTPIIKTPIEALTGKDFFTGGDLRRTNANTFGRIMDATNTPKAMKDFFGYKKEFDDAGRPRYTVDGVRYQLFVRSFIFSRIMSTSDRQFRDYLGDQNLTGAMLDVLTGLRFKDLNLDDQKRRLLFRRRSQLRDSLGRRGVFPQYSIPGRPNTEGLQ